MPTVPALTSKERVRDSSIVAEIGISLAVEGLLRAGFRVAVPIVDEGHDLIAYKQSRYWRIQVKATDNRNPRNGCRVPIRRGKNRRSHYGYDTVDAFIAVHIGTGQLLCVPFERAVGWSALYFRSHGKYSGFSALHGLRPHGGRRRLAGK